MKLCIALPLIFFVALTTCQSSDQGASSTAGVPEKPEKKPGLTQRLLKPWTFFHSTDGAAAKGGVNWKQLALTVSLDPIPLKLSETRQIKVTLHLRNQGKRLEQLEFPTTQRIEVLVKNASGKTVEQWSEDQSFASEPTLVAINPNERLEYTVSISTRDLTVGQTYSVEAFFPNYEHLKAVTTLTPEK